MANLFLLTQNYTAFSREHADQIQTEKETRTKTKTKNKSVIIMITRFNFKEHNYRDRTNFNEFLIVYKNLQIITRI